MLHNNKSMTTPLAGMSAEDLAQKLSGKIGVGGEEALLDLLDTNNSRVLDTSNITHNDSTTETNTSADTAVGTDSKENTVHDDKDEPPSTASPDSTTKGPKRISLEGLHSFHEDLTGPATAVCPCDTPILDLITLNILPAIALSRLMGGDIFGTMNILPKFCSCREQNMSTRVILFARLANLHPCTVANVDKCCRQQRDTLTRFMSTFSLVMSLPT